MYIETPGLNYFNAKMPGVFVFLESDADNGRKELRLLLNTEAGGKNELVSIPLHIEEGTISDAFEAMSREAKKHMPGNEWLLLDDSPEEVIETLMPIVSLVLYLCSQAADYTGNLKPVRPRPKRTRKGKRYFPPSQPQVWDVGVRVGAALMAAFAKAESTSGTESGMRARPRGHIRRAHWHGYWKGPKEKQKLVLRWIPPLAINVGDFDQMPTVIHEVDFKKA